MGDYLSLEDLEWLGSLLPVVSGGLAGSILTYFLHYRGRRKNRPRLAVREVFLDYTLPADGGGFKFEELSVAYQGQSYDNLLLYNLEIKNTSTRAVDETPFVITLQEDATILADEYYTSPIQQTIEKNVNRLEGNAVRYSFGRLRPGDSAYLKLLIAGHGPAGCHFRGSDQVEVLVGGSATASSFEDDLKQVLYLAALFLLAGAVPILGAVLRAGIVMSSYSIILRIYNHFRSSFYPPADSTSIGPIVYSDTGNVFIGPNSADRSRLGLVSIDDRQESGRKNVTPGENQESRLIPDGKTHVVEITKES